VIYLGRASPRASSGRLEMLASRAGSLSLSDLAPGGVYLAAPVARGTGALLPHPFTLTSTGLAASRRGLLSVALAVALRAQPLAGTLALWSPDFPQRSFRLRRDQTAHTATLEFSTSGPVASVLGAREKPAPEGPARNGYRDRALQGAVIGDGDLAVDDLLLDLVDLIDEVLRDQRFVERVQREVDAVLCQAEVQPAAHELAVHDVHDRVVRRDVDALEHARQTVVQRGGVVVRVAGRVLVAVDADEEHGRRAGAAGGL